MERVMLCAAMAVGMGAFALSVEGAPRKGIRQITEPKVMARADGSVFRYRWHEPTEVKPGEKYPLVVFLHGAGERGTNNVSQLNYGAQPIADWFQKKGAEFYFIAGQVPRKELFKELWVNVSWCTYEHTLPEHPSSCMAALIDLIGQVLASDRPIDHDRVYVTGISMGGYGTWDIISRKPEWFAAAMPVCGGGDNNQAVKLRDLPIWIHHGDFDQLVPVWRARTMIDALHRAGSHVARYSEYPGCGHDSHVPAYNDATHLDWLFSQRRVKRPDWQEVKKSAKGFVAPARRYEVRFEFTEDGGKTWHVGLIRRVPGWPIRLVDDVALANPPYSFEYDLDDVEDWWTLKMKKEGSTYRNLKARPLPEWK